MHLLTSYIEKLYYLIIYYILIIVTKGKMTDGWEEMQKKRLELAERMYPTYRIEGNVFVEAQGKVYQYHKTMRGYQLDSTNLTPKELNDKIAKDLGNVEYHQFSPYAFPRDSGPHKEWLNSNEDISELYVSSHGCDPATEEWIAPHTRDDGVTVKGFCRKKRNRY